MIEFDLTTNGANRVMHHLRDLGLPRYGTVAVDSVDVAISDPANGRR